MDGCSVQYAENSVSDVVPRINGGAVIEERSPLNDAMDCSHVSELGAGDCSQAVL